LLVLHLPVILLVAVWANKKGILLGKDTWTSIVKCDALIHTDDAGAIGATKHISPIATRAAPLSKQSVK
jgi:hypothetical protein